MGSPLQGQKTQTLDAQQARLRELEEYERYRREWAMLFYKPYKRQIEFHNQGGKYRERALIAGNQLGKTLCAAHEVAFHMTGHYPSWWEGKRFTKPNLWWIGSKTAELTRDGAQVKLLGGAGQHGTGAIPKDLLSEQPKLARGTPDAVEIFRVRHKSGGISEGIFKAFADGREKWQAGTVDGIWEDEEPDEDVHSEAVTRTNATKGIVLLTLTPLKGMSSVVMKFLKPEPGDPPRLHVNMTIDDVEHYTEEEKRLIVAAYPSHEREARAKGIPMLGAGRIFPVSEESIVVDDFPIPETWPEIGGLDFGWDHPSAAVKIAIDPVKKCRYLVADYRARETLPVLHAAALKPWGDIPWAWPHDGLQHDKASGEQLAQIYRKHGLKLVSEHAQFPDERGNGVEAGLWSMLELMQTGQWKVFRTCRLWFEEFLMYHRVVKDGKVTIQKLREDVISASRYAHMMERYAKPRLREEEALRKRYGKPRMKFSGGSWMSM